MQSTPLADSSSPTSAFAGRLPAFDRHYLVAQPIPYRFVEPSGKTSSSGGVLQGGQSVWLENAIERKRLSPLVRGFVDSLGVIVVDPRWLKKADGLI